MAKIFMICPVRNAPEEVQKLLREYASKLKKEGHQVHYPPDNTPQDDPVGVTICETNFRAILEADEVHIWYDKTSQGAHFDFGGVFMLTRVLGYRKKIVFINYDWLLSRMDEEERKGKKYWKVLKFLDEETQGGEE